MLYVDEFPVLELIDTQWDVNLQYSVNIELYHLELIDTQWDVNNSETAYMLRQYSAELIDTQWDVNFSLIWRRRSIQTELIDTQWDVNNITCYGIA